MTNMRFLSIVGNSFGCSASGERLVSAARDGDLLEAQALLEYNPRLARYSTFGVRNTPLHYSAAQGHHEIVCLLLESGVDINLRNYRGQTALMQACQYGHWEVAQILILFKANIYRADYLNGGTALHLAALNGHTRCIRLLLADYVPSTPDFYSILRKGSGNDNSVSEFDESTLHAIINRPADGGVTALHMAAMNGHVETVHLLLDLGASVSEATVEDGATIDLIGAGSTPLHYAACGGNAQCCRLLIARGASLTAQNANGYGKVILRTSKDDQSECKAWLTGPRALFLYFSNMVVIAVPYGNVQVSVLHASSPEYRQQISKHCILSKKWTPLMVARSWNRDWLEDILSQESGGERSLSPSPYLCLPLMSIVDIARECGWRSNDSPSPCVVDPCVVCLERKCTVAAQGCFHEFCTYCALYLCSTTSTSTTSHGPPGSIPCPLCRHGIVSFVKLEGTRPVSKEIPLRACLADIHDSTSLEKALCKPDFSCAPLVPAPSVQSLNCQIFPSVKFNPGLCLGAQDASPENQLVRCSRSSFRRSASPTECRNWLCSFMQSVPTGSGC